MLYIGLSMGWVRNYGQGLGAGSGIKSSVRVRVRVVDQGLC